MMYSTDAVARKTLHHPHEQPLVAAQALLNLSPCTHSTNGKIDGKQATVIAVLLVKAAQLCQPTP